MLAHTECLSNAASENPTFSITNPNSKKSCLIGQTVVSTVMSGSIFAAFRMVDYVHTARAFFLLRHHYKELSVSTGTFFLQ